MKQVLQSILTGRVAVEEVPAPTIEPGMLRVRNRCSAISIGTERATIQRVQRGPVGVALSQPKRVQDLLRQLANEGLGPTLEKVRTRFEQSIPLGYSAAGIVHEVGAGAEGFRVGDPVACAGYGYASHAEVLCVPQTLCAKIPRGISWEEASFTTLGAIAFQGIRVADLKIGETVAVLGLGMIGQLLSQAAQAAGCRVFGVDPRPERVALAQELGAEAGCSPADRAAFLQAGLSFTGGRGFDAVLIAAASEETDLLLLAGELARERGVVVVIGDVPLSVPRETFYGKELQLRLARSYGPGRYDPSYERHGVDYPFPYVRWTAQRNMAAFLQLLEAGKMRVSPLVTHRFPLDQAVEAYAAILAQPSTPPLGVLLQYEGVAQAASPFPPPSAVPKKAAALMPGTIGVGIIGAGRFAAGQLIPRLRRFPGVRLAAVAAGHGASAQAAARRFGIPSAVTGHRALLQDPSVQAVVIAAPHHLHAGMVLDALKAGRHCFVEKPLCLTQEDLNEIASVYRSLSVPLVLSVGFNRRFSWVSQTAKSHFQDRQGPLTILYRVNAGPAPQEGWWSDPAVSGGRILGETGHFIDLMGFLTGTHPVQVSTFAPRWEPGQAGQETLVSTFGFADGSLGTLAYSTQGDRACPKERVELFADGMTAVIDDFRSVSLYARGRRKLFRRFVQEKGFRAELAAFIEAVRSGGDPPIPFSELYSTTLATFKVLESLRQGKTVSLDLPPHAGR